MHCHAPASTHPALAEAPIEVSLCVRFGECSMQEWPVRTFCGGAIQKCPTYKLLTAESFENSLAKSWSRLSPRHYTTGHSVYASHTPSLQIADAYMAPPSHVRDYHTRPGGRLPGSNSAEVIVTHTRTHSLAHKHTNIHTSTHTDTNPVTHSHTRHSHTRQTRTWFLHRMFGTTTPGPAVGCPGRTRPRYLSHTHALTHT